jgi:diadenosine tetraphosphatase ApaH/serine/threonine PP2A family protein phosphatase
VTRLALLADVHANLEALEAVLAHLADWPDARIVAAGDLVGYGADPEACIERVRARAGLCVAGNHEAMVLGRLGFDRCVYAGIRAARWTRTALSAASRAWIAGLPSTLEIPPDLVVCHGRPSDPEFYVSSAARAEDTLRELAETSPRARVLVCGHTHHQMLHAQGESRQVVVGIPLALPRATRCLVNPGAVGQSRDRKPLARYARYDPEQHAVTFYELAYDHQQARDKMRRAGLVAEVAIPDGAGHHRWRTRWARWAARGTPS